MTLLHQDRGIISPVQDGIASAGIAEQAARADHVHSALGLSTQLWSKLSADMNTTADQAMVKAFNFTNHIIDQILIVNASASLTLAAGGFYTAASKGGVAI